MFVPFFPFFCAICLVFVVKCSHLAGIDAFGAFRHEENAEGGEDQLQIRDDGHVVDVHQVEFQFLIGIRVVFAVDLGIAGEAGFDLKAEPEVREELIVLLRDLRPFRSGSHHAHVPFQDVPKLRQFVQAALADEPADRRDALILVPGREAGHAVLLGIHPHAAELIDGELSSVLGEAHLLIDRGAAVVEVDRRRRDQKNRAQEDQGRAGRDDVECPLEDGVFRVRRAARDEEDRRVEALDMLRFLHDDVADVWQEEADDALFLAVFGDAVAAAAVHPRDEDGVIALQLMPDALEAVTVVTELLIDAVEALARLSAEGAEALFVQFVAVDQDRPLHRIEAEIVPVGEVGPERIKDELNREHTEEDPRRVPVFPGKADDEPHDRRAEELGQALGEDEGADPRIAEEISVIGTQEEKQKNAVSEGNIIVIPEAVARQVGEPAEAVQQPENIKKQNTQPEVRKLHAHQVKALSAFISCFHGYDLPAFVSFMPARRFRCLDRFFFAGLLSPAGPRSCRGNPGAFCARASSSRRGTFPAGPRSSRRAYSRLRRYRTEKPGAFHASPSTVSRWRSPSPTEGRSGCPRSCPGRRAFGSVLR